MFGRLRGPDGPGRSYLLLTPRSHGRDACGANAGTGQAASATVTSNRGTATNVSGSTGGTPYRSLAMSHAFAGDQLENLRGAESTRSWNPPRRIFDPGICGVRGQYVSCLAGGAYGPGGGFAGRIVPRPANMANRRWVASTTGRPPLGSRPAFPPGPAELLAHSQQSHQTGRGYALYSWARWLAYARQARTSSCAKPG